jgi:ATP-dependent RNA helicase RhlE
MSFLEFGLVPELLTSLNALGHTAPTPIQHAATPLILQGRDVVGIAPTGSGKTLAYGLALLDALCRTKGAGKSSDTRQVQCLVLVPTRELATQVGEALRGLANRLPVGLQIQMVFGGVSINPQMQRLARSGVDVLVATPGRLLDLVAQRAVSLDELTTLVLDEADRLLDLGFAHELTRILTLCPQARQSLMFSATFAASVQGLAQSLLHEPVHLDLRPAQLGAESSDHSTTVAALPIVQRAFAVDEHRRTALLRQLLATHAWPRVLVFVASQHAAERVAMKLRKTLPGQGAALESIEAEPFHGGLSQGKRTQVLLDFKASRVRVVVATDVAARGLDIAELPVVLNYDLPRASADYIHRIGRTGRAGASGLAVSLVTPAVGAHWGLIAKRQGLDVALEVLPGFELHPQAHGARSGWTAHDPADDAGTHEAADVEDGDNDPAQPSQGLDPNGGIKGRRPSKKDKLRAQNVVNTANTANTANTIRH